MNDNQNMNVNNVNNNQNGSNPIPTGANPSQNDYYNNDNYYANNNYASNNANYSDTSYEEPKENNGLWWKILVGVLLLLIIIIIILKSIGGSKSSETKYTELKNSLCKAAETYVGQNAGLIDTSSPGASVAIKLRKLSDASLISARLENPDYDGSLFKKSSVDKYYSLDNSVRLTLLTNGEYSCELVNNSSDITAPELRLMGDAEIELAVGTEFEDPGYTATDDFDGDIKDKVTRSGNVDTTKAGEYTITYAVTDTAGNVTSKTRKVKVSEYANIEITLGSILDKVTPMISLKGSNPYCLVKGQTFVEPGAVATDNVDGTITNKIAITNKVTGNLMGAFRVVYKVEDSSGNQAIAYRAVIVTTECPEQNNEELVANTAPVITLIGKSAVTIQKGTQYLDLGATAHDKEDGDLTNSIITDTTGVKTNSAGIYKVFYRVTDSEGKTTTAVRTVTVKETVSGNPSVRFTTTKSNITVFLGEGTASLIAAPRAVNENGIAVSVNTTIEDYTTKVAVSSINWNLVGKYRVTYTAVHGNGTVKQTKSIVVTITSKGVTIGGPNELTMTRRNSGCDLSEADLRNGGVTFTSGNSSAPIVSIEATERAACVVGTYDVKVYARDTSNDSTSKSIKVKVIEGDSPIDISAPSKVIITSNSLSSDPYNYAGKWAGGSVTGIALNFTATPKTGTTIAYYEYSDDCTTADGQVNTTSATTGTMTWAFEGKNNVCIRAVTTAGAKGPWSDPAKLYLDKTGPEVDFTHTWKDGADDWYNTPTLTVSYDAKDKNGSGLDHFEYTYDDVRGKYGDKVTNPKTVEEGSGKLTLYENTESARPKLFVYVRAVDKAGNFGEWTLNPAFANIDTVKPNAPTLEAVGSGTSSVKINATVTDGTSPRQSGFGKLVYKIVTDGQTQCPDGKYVWLQPGWVGIPEHEQIPNPCVNSTEYVEDTKTITMPINTSKTTVTSEVTVNAVDKAGNRSDAAGTITVKVAPGTLLENIIIKNGTTEIKDGESCSTKAIYVGDKITLKVSPVPSTSTGNSPSWGSSAATVATIEPKTGTLEAVITVKTVGKTIITVKMGGISKSCVVESKKSDSGGTDPGSGDPGSGGGCSKAELKTPTACSSTALVACKDQGGVTSTSCQTANSSDKCYYYKCNSIANCAKYSANGVCSACNSGYTLISNYCSKNPATGSIAHCAKYSSDEVCSACESGYTLISNYCSSNNGSCPSGTYNSSTCSGKCSSSQTCAASSTSGCYACKVKCAYTTYAQAESAAKKSCTDGYSVQPPREGCYQYTCDTVWYNKTTKTCKTYNKTKVAGGTCRCKYETTPTTKGGSCSGNTCTCPPGYSVAGNACSTYKSCSCSYKNYAYKDGTCKTTGCSCALGSSVTNNKCTVTETDGTCKEWNTATTVRVNSCTPSSSNSTVVTCSRTT